MTKVNFDNAMENEYLSFNGLPEKEASYLATPLLQNFSDLKHAFTTRLGGISPKPYDSLNLSQKTGDTKTNINSNIDSISQKLDIDANLFFLEQEHGNEILVIEKDLIPLRKRHYDGAISLECNIPISIITADCLAILFYDPQKRAIGAVHAGWKGTASGIAEKTINLMGSTFGCQPSDIVAAMGPAIGPCCYEVNHVVVNTFSRRGEEGMEEWNRSSSSSSTDQNELWSLDLAEANKVQLLRAGIKGKNITASPFCTSCREDLFYSHRRDGDKTGRLAAIIMMSEKSEN